MTHAPSLRIALSALLSTSFSLGLIAQSAPPTEEAPTELAPLLVTADLWSSELDRTSASATVFDAAQLATHGQQHFADLISSTPNLTWTGGTSRPRFFQIRGIGENSQFEGEAPDSSIRFLVDDIDFTGLGGVASLFDVQQVEVLRGPQAGAFGANAAGGMIKMVTADPTPYLTGMTELTIAQDSLRSAGFAVGGPVISDTPDKLMFRFAVQQTEANGWRDNAFLNRSDTNAQDELTLRLKLRANPTADWQWNAMLFYADMDNGYDEFSLDNTGFTTFSDQPGVDLQESAAASLRGTYTGAEAFAFTTKTSYTDSDSIYSFDSDWTNLTDPRGYDLFLETQRHRQVFNQEIRFDSPLTTDATAPRWTVGGYYESTVEDTFLTAGFGGASTTFDATTLAVFGQWRQSLGPNTRLIAGLRVEDYDLTTDIEFRSDIDFSDTLIGGKLVLEHDLNERDLLFVSLTHGYKAGGANIYNFLVVPDEGPADYTTETLWNLELGWRGRSADGRVSGEIIGFYLDRNEPQVRDSAGFGASFTYFVDNGTAAAIYGIESNFRAQLTDRFSAYGSLGLMESDLDPFTLNNPNADPAGGRALANVPASSYRLGLRFDATASTTGFWASAEVTGRDSYFESNTHNETRRAYLVVNASLGYRMDAWSFTLWARNLLDDGYKNRIFYFGNAGPNFETRRYESPAPPRQLGATVRYSF
jgi:iron complex outermembrane receptor protein